MVERKNSKIPLNIFSSFLLKHCGKMCSNWQSGSASTLASASTLKNGSGAYLQVSWQALLCLNITIVNPWYPFWVSTPKLMQTLGVTRPLESRKKKQLDFVIPVAKQEYQWSLSPRKERRHHWNMNICSWNSWKKTKFVSWKLLRNEINK